MTQKALKQALEAITQYLAESPDPSEEAVERLCDAASAARKALAQPEQGEPVAWMFQHEETGRIMFVEAQQLEWGFEKGNPRLKKIGPLYTTPQPKQAQGEPVAVVTGVYGGRFTYAPLKDSVILPVGMAFYSSPQQRNPLTYEQIADIVIEMNGNEPPALFWKDLTRAIEAAHGIKE
jgi:hypothetical protein